MGRLIPQLAKVCPKLQTLSLLYNPGVPNPLNDENKEKYQAHRWYVLSRMPKLENLDNTVVTEEEREYVKKRKLSEFGPVAMSGGGGIILSSLKKDVAGFHVVKEGELTVMEAEAMEANSNSNSGTQHEATASSIEYYTWEPIFAKAGEGKLLLFNDAKDVRPEAIISLSGYEVSVVEDTKILSKVAPNLEVLELKHISKPKIMLMCKDKQTLAEWMPVLVTECEVDNSKAKDWDELEKQRERMLSMQNALAEKSTQIRLKRALDQSYAIDANEVKLIRVLGHGGFGTVYLANVRGKSVACKVFHNQKLSNEALDDFCTEMEILSKIHHPHIINFIGACLEPLMIVTELMAGGDLEKLLLDVSGTPLSLLTRLQMAKDAALGMAWLHGSDPMILHRDVKTANFLVDENLRVVVADFGLSDKLRKGSSTWDDDGYKGTIYYTAPEILKNAVFNEKSDVYSFGIVLWQLLTRKELYPEFKRVHSNELERAMLDNVVFKGVRPRLPDIESESDQKKHDKSLKSNASNSDIASANSVAGAHHYSPKSFRDLIEDCWAQDPSARPSFDEVVERMDQVILEHAIPNERAREMWVEWFPGRHQVRWKAFWEHFALVCTQPPERMIKHDLAGATPPRTPIKRSVTEVPSIGSPSSPNAKITGVTAAMVASGSASNLSDINGALDAANNKSKSIFSAAEGASKNSSGISSSLSQSTISILNDLPLKLLIHELLSPHQDMVLHQVNSDVVHIDQWGNFAQWFGPIGYPGHNPATYAQSIAKNKWFFGEVTINQAFNILNGQESGTFLVRYSLSRRGDYSVSFVTPSGAIAHQHIDRRVSINPKSRDNPVVIQYFIPATGQAYDSLFDLIDDQPYLRNRAYGWPFGWIFAGRLSAADIEDNFLDTAQDLELQTIRSPRKAH